MAASSQQIPLGVTATGPAYSGYPNADPVTFYNQDTANTVYLATVNTITVGAGNSIPLPPGASVTLPGTVTRYAVAQAGTAPLVIIPGGASFSSSTDITTTGSVTVTGGTVAVSGVGGTVAVNGTVAISGTPTVDIGTVSGSIDIGSVAGNVDVVGQGGFINPGQVGALFTSATTVIGPNGFTNLTPGGINVVNYASIILSVGQIPNSSVAAGAAVCAIVVINWFDPVTFAAIATDQVSILCSTGVSQAVWELPCRGGAFNLTVKNIGSVGNLTVSNSPSILVFGSYRVIPNIRVVESNLSAAGLVLTGCSVTVQGLPVYQIAEWVASIAFTWAGAVTNQVIPLPQWVGEVTGYYQDTTTALARNATIVDLTYALQGNVVSGSGYTSGIVLNIPGAIDTNPVPFSINLPPTQCALIIDTPAAVGSFVMSLVGVGN
jgi:hypothetical protein